MSQRAIQDGQTPILRQLPVTEHALDAMAFRDSKSPRRLPYCSNIFTKRWAPHIRHIKTRGLSISKQCIELFSRSRAAMNDSHKLMRYLATIPPLAQQIDEGLALRNSSLQHRRRRLESRLSKNLCGCSQLHKFGLLLFLGQLPSQPVV